MKRLVGIALVGLASLFLSGAAHAEELQNEQIEIAYVEPANPDFAHFYAGLKKRQVLEELRAFLAPLKLPRKISDQGRPMQRADPPLRAGRAGRHLL